MKNLNRILNIWRNLEVHYTNSKMDSRLDYIKKIIGYTDGSTKVDYILGKLKGEAPGYNTEELQEYVRITKVLDGAKQLIETNSLLTIDDFEKFVNTCIVINRKMQDRKQLPKDYFDKLSYNHKPMVKERSLETSFGDIYNKLEGFGDVTKLVDGNVVTLTLKDDNATILYNESVLANLIEIHDTNNFAKNVVYIAAKLSEQGKLDTNQVFLNTNYFKVDKNEITVTIGELVNTSKIYSYNKIINHQSIGYIVTLKTVYGNVKLVCVDEYKN